MLGVALNQAEQRQEALYYMDCARIKFKAVGDIYNLARAYHVISWVHVDEHRLPDALDAVEEAWKYAQLTMTLGRILFNTNQDAKAWKYIEISLINASYIGDQYQVARALEYMGYGYLCIGDYQNAYGAYEAAADNFLGATFPDAVERCKTNMARIESKKENPDIVIGYYRPATNLDDDTLFYPPYSNICKSTAHFSFSWINIAL
jgi:tetratricopeptide (TPR) repeat protein